MNLKFYRDPDPTPGVRQYTVTNPNKTGALVLGTVTNRPGGWWRATTREGRSVTSFAHTRAEAAEALVRAHAS